VVSKYKTNRKRPSSPACKALLFCTGLAPHYYVMIPIISIIYVYKILKMERGPIPSILILELPISLLMRMALPKTSTPEVLPVFDELIGLPIDRPDRDPARVYLAGLAPGSRRTMAQALDQIARIASNGQFGAGERPRAALRYEHTRAIRAALRDLISPRTGHSYVMENVMKPVCQIQSRAESIG
jgi:hypothetical protein